MQEESQTNLQQEYTPVLPEKSGNNNSAVYLVIIFLLLAIIGFLGWKYVFGEKIMSSFSPAIPIPQVTSTPTVVVDQTANWKTYTDNPGMYSFQYPPNFTLTIRPSGIQPKYNYITVSYTTREVGKGAPVPIPDDFGFTVDVYAKDSEQGNYWSSNPWLQINSLKVDGYSVSQGKTFAGFGPSPEIFDAKNAQVYNLHTVTTVADKVYVFSAIPSNSKHINFYDQILSTFKFVDNRILLTADNTQQHNGKTSEERCSVKFNQDKANTISDYTNSAKGISFNVPYNSEWGNEKYKINPFEEDLKNNQVVFGNLSIGEGCGWMRENNLRFMPVRDVNDAIKEVEGRQSDMCKIKPTQDTVNGLTILRYSATCGIAQNAYIQVIGKKFNYEFYSFFGDAKGLEEIVKTVKLIN